MSVRNDETAIAATPSAGLAAVPEESSQYVVIEHHMLDIWG
jgi:hypothetical protein